MSYPVIVFASSLTSLAIGLRIGWLACRASILKAAPDEPEEPPPVHTNRGWDNPHGPGGHFIKRTPHFGEAIEPEDSSKKN